MCAVQLVGDKKNYCREICGVLPCIPLAPLEGCFWFQLGVVDAEGGEKVSVSVSGIGSHTHTLNFPLFLTNSISVSPLNFSFLSVIHILLADGFACFVPQREPSCTDVLPGLQFLELAWSSHPSRTSGPDEELQRLHLAASYSTWGFCPQTPRPPPLPLPFSHPECSFETREAARRGNPS